MPVNENTEKGKGMSSGRLKKASMSKRAVAYFGVSALVALLLGVHLSAFVTPAAAAENCSNETIRVEEGAAAMALPECRAYELVSPPGSVPSLGGLAAIAALSGERFAYSVNQPAPSSEAESTSLLATRDTSGWTVQSVTPPQGGRRSDQFACLPSMFLSDELNRGVLSDGWTVFVGENEEVCEGDDPPLVAGESRGVANLFLRNNEDDAYELIDRAPTSGAPANALLEDATSDLSRVVFAEEAALTPEAPAGLDLYEWTGSTDRLVSLLPDGEPVPGELANSRQGSSTYTNAVSASGETLFFYSEGDLLARLHVAQEVAPNDACSVGEAIKACTVQVDAAVPGAPGPSGGGTFVYASENGSRVFFTDSNRLTVDSTAKPEEPDLYEYDMETESLADLSVSSTGPAEVLGFSGASTNGSYVYFVARNVLTGSQVNSYGESAVDREANLYLRHAGTTTFIATLEDKGLGSESDKGDWQESIAGRNEGNLTSRVSADGEYLAFDSVRSLTGYDNEPLEPGDCEKGRCREIFLYDAHENKLACISCAADEAAPTGPAEIEGPEPELETPERPGYLRRNLIEGGRVFFDTRTALVPQATNGAANVYEYDNGEVHLISSGTSAGASVFLDASANGEDVFFSTGQGLVQSDTDNADSVYDARVDGGFSSSAGEASPVSACESAEACKAPPSESPAQLFPASSVLAAGGGLTVPPVPVTPSPPTGRTSVKHSLTRGQKLTRALKTCTTKPRRKRATCERQARKRYGAKAGADAKRAHGKASGKSDRRGGR